MRKIKKKYGLTIRPNTRFVMLYSGTNKHKFVNPCGDSRWGGITKYIDIDQEIISSKSSRGKKDELGSVIRDFSVIRSQIKDLYGRMKKEHGY